jgi:lipopolysaccharide biosynthesis glycosyltransferase
MNIVYATDNGYAQHVAVSIYSLLSSVADAATLRIYILDNKLSSVSKSKINKVAGQFGVDISFIDISNINKMLPDKIDTANLSISTYCRLFVSKLLPNDIDELLYLDCDTLIEDDITTIRKFIDGDDWYVAGVEDSMYPHMKEQIGLKVSDLYINAGVLYINLKKWRENNCIESFLQFINRYDGAVPHLDQGVINGVFKTGKIKLPLAYNVQAPIFAFHKLSRLIRFYSLTSFYSEKEFLAAKKQPILIHYTSFFVERPWFKFCIHPLKTKYRNALKRTPFADSGLLQNRIGFAQKIKDVCFKYLQPIYLILR